MTCEAGRRASSFALRVGAASRRAYRRGAIVLVSCILAMYAKTAVAQEGHSVGADYRLVERLQHGTVHPDQPLDLHLSKLRKQIELPCSSWTTEAETSVLLCASCSGAGY